MDTTPEVSPYLKRPLRSLEEVLRAREERDRRLAARRQPAAAGAGRPPADNVIPIDLKRRPRAPRR
jgi:hypothetical protein